MIKANVRAFIPYMKRWRIAIVAKFGHCRNMLGPASMGLEPGIERNTNQSLSFFGQEHGNKDPD
jgi:hypothetical protein